MAKEVGCKTMNGLGMMLFQGFQVQMQEEVNGNSYLGTRGVYANEKFYVINGNAIEAYRMGDYVKIDDLLL